MKVKRKEGAKNPIRIDIDDGEASALLCVLRCVGGEMSGPRGNISKLLEGLHSAGVTDGNIRREGTTWLWEG